MSYLAFRLGRRCWTNGGRVALIPVLSVQYSLSYDFWRGSGKIVTLALCFLIVVSCTSMELFV